MCKCLYGVYDMYVKVFISPGAVCGTAVVSHPDTGAETELGLLQEQYFLLPTESSLQPHKVYP